MTCIKVMPLARIEVGPYVTQQFLVTEWDDNPPRWNRASSMSAHYSVNLDDGDILMYVGSEGLTSHHLQTDYRHRFMAVTLLISLGLPPTEWTADKLEELWQSTFGGDDDR